MFRAGSRLAQMQLKKAKVSSRRMIGSVASAATSTGREGDEKCQLLPNKCSLVSNDHSLTFQFPRSTCNVCNGPQFTVEEERTGLGGGFDERGTVEYKEREESDDEFDDLGRKKKKYKMPYKKPMIVQSVPDPPSEPEEEEDEEEEDDDDEGDLSKYDLWGDPDEDKKDGKEDNKTSNGNQAKEESSKVSESKRLRSRSKDSKKRSRRSRSSRFKMIGLDFV